VEPPPSHGEADGRPEHQVLIPHRAVADAASGEADVPRVDVGGREPSKRQRGDRIGLDQADSAPLGLHGGGRPRALRRLYPEVEQLPHRGSSPRAVLASDSNSWATRRASRLVPRTVLETWTGRPVPSRPTNVRTSKTPGRRSLIVVINAQPSASCRREVGIFVGMGASIGPHPGSPGLVDVQS
jgi:hypothetical protein